MNLKTQKVIGILEEDLALRKFLTGLLEPEGYRVEVFPDLETVSQKEVFPDAFLCSVSSLALNGKAGLQTLRSCCPEASVVILPQPAEIERAHELIAEGALTLIPKPFQTWELLHRVQQACDTAELKRQNRWLKRREHLEPNSEAKNLIADDPTLDELEKRYIEIILKKAGGRKDRASRMLGINRRTLYRKEREYGWVAPSAQAPVLESLKQAAGQ
jgi:DNA-binding NtrC family response regulator